MLGCPGRSDTKYQQTTTTTTINHTTSQRRHLASSTSNISRIPDRALRSTGKVTHPSNHTALAPSCSTGSTQRSESISGVTLPHHDPFDFFFFFFQTPLGEMNEWKLNCPPGGERAGSLEKVASNSLRMPVREAESHRNSAVVVVVFFPGVSCHRPSADTSSESDVSATSTSTT